jgi:hypothetical protein
MTQTVEAHGRMTCSVAVSPDVVDSGAELTLRGRVSCAPACDLRGHTLLVTDQAGAEVGRAQLTASDTGTSETSDFVLKAPIDAGEYTWLVVCPAVVKEGVSYAEASTPVSFTVTRHATHVVAWDVPPAIVVGERFKLKLGIRCSSECQPAHRRFEILDHEGAVVATGSISGEIWPGTSALYVAEAELDAPVEEGLYTWSVRVPASDLGAPHEEGAVSIGVRAVSRPECLVTVAVVDKDSQAPLPGARVVMHPFRTVTDDRGVAELRVAKGAYTLFASQTCYLTFGLPVEVTADMTASAELCLEPATERN